MEIDRWGQPVERVTLERPPQPAPITRDELKALIAVVVAYTRRQPDEGMVAVWGTQAQMGRWTYEEAVRAIHQWGYDRAPDAWLEPSDVTRAIRAERQDRALREEQQRMESRPADPATAERVREVVTEIVAKLGWEDDPGTTPRAIAPLLSEPCPHCGATVGSHCTTGPPHFRALRKSGCHPARAERLATRLQGSA